MRGMREHIEQLDAFNAVARQRRDIFSHRLRVAAGVDDVVRCHLAQIVAQRFPDAPARRVHQHQFRHIVLPRRELRGVQRLEVQPGQPKLCGRLSGTGNRFGGDLNPGKLHVWRGAVQTEAAHPAEQIPHMMDI